MNQTYIKQHFPKTEISNVSCNKNSDTIIVSGRELLKIVKVKNDKIHDVINLRTTKTQNYTSSTWAEFNPLNNSYFASAGIRGHLVIWNLQPSGPVIDVNYQNHKNQAINKISWSPNNQNLIMSCSLDCSVKIWDKTQNQPIQKIQKNDNIRDAKFHYFNQNQIALASEVHMEIYDLRNILKPLMIKSNAHNQTIMSLDFNPHDESILATGSLDQDIKFWNISQIEPELISKISNQTGVRQQIKNKYQKNYLSLKYLYI